MTLTRRNFLMLAPLGVAACSAQPRPGSQSDAAALANAIRALSPAVDTAEANRAAQLAYAHTFALAQAYQITDPPLIHNAKVNAGRKPRGLCWHWAEDMEARLKAENFTTLSMHRAIANADSRIFIDHSTAVISAQGATMQDGIVLDPWRQGGTLFWSPVITDRRYKWEERETVLRRYGRIRYVQQGADVS